MGTGNWSRRAAIVLALAAALQFTPAAAVLPGVQLSESEPSNTSSVSARTRALPRQPSDRAGSAGHSGPVRDSVPVKAAGLQTAEQSTPPQRPARLRIPSIGLDLAVQPVGVASDGSMAMPTTTLRAAWYRFGPAPGDRNGTAVIAGHIDTRRQGLGPFARLVMVPAGARITVLDTVGHRTSYVVTGRQRTAKASADFAQLFRRDGAPRLRLITCAPPYRSDIGYRDLLILTAVPR
ncbi:MAG TPA: class F sortase [Microlunatus sp.]